MLLFVLWVHGRRAATLTAGTVSASFRHGHPGNTVADAIVGGALIGIFTLVGFEAAADMAEEAVDARRTVPRAMIAAAA